MWLTMEQNKICENCKHWSGYTNPITINGKIFGTCAKNAVSADAGDHIVLTGSYGHCQMQENESFVMKEELAELDEANIPEHEIYGLVPGVDFPGTLYKSIK